jgi:hypothetical protein
MVEAILDGWADKRMMLERLERPLPVGWEEQRAALDPRHRQIQGSNAIRI